MTEELQTKVEKYEEFLNEVLQEDLRIVLDHRDKLYQQTADYMQLQTLIEKIQGAHLQESPLKTKVDIGCNCYMQAVVPDASKICICIGLNIYVEYSLPEALRFIERKIKLLTAASDQLTKSAAQIKAHIKLVLEGLRELQNISDIAEKPYRALWD